GSAVRRCTTATSAVSSGARPRKEKTMSDTSKLASKVTSVQRVNTVGGVAPKAGCSQAAVGTPARINYTADYYFFTAK
ncbi:MAG: hypothetical protein DMD84_04275, partial [Candidatus Rokuibacteriota bacterium]